MPVVWTGALVAAMIAVASSAWAGAPELPTELVIDPSDPMRMVLRYKNARDGLIHSHDGGATWLAQCSQGIPGPKGPLDRIGPIALRAQGGLFVAQYDGLLRGDRNGCGFEPEVALEGVWITDVAPHPTDGDVLFATTARTTGESNAVMRRAADGGWESLGDNGDLLLDRVVPVALPGDGLRVYASGRRPTPLASGQADYVIVVSDDLGQTWAEHPIGEVGGMTTQVQLEAVDPTDPDRIVVSAVLFQRESMNQPDAPPDRLLVSGDQGATFNEYLTLTQFGGIDLAPDGRVFVGDLGSSFDPAAPSGLLSAASLDETPSHVMEGTHIACIKYLPSRSQVFVCQRLEGGFVSPDGSDYETAFAFSQVAALVQCDGVDIVPMCAEQLAAGWCKSAHFSRAQICCPYQHLLPPENMPELKPNCEDMADSTMAPAGDGDGDGDGNPGPTAGSDPSSMGGAGGEDGLGMMDPTPVPPEEADEDSGDGTDNGGGCGCRIAGRPTMGLGHWAALSCSAALALRRSRRRRARATRRSGC